MGLEERTVIFDMDGVIFDTENLYLDCWSKIAAEYNIEGIESFFYKCIGIKIDECPIVFEETYGKRFEYGELNGKVSDLFFRFLAENGMPLKRGVRELLDGLTQKGYQIGLASSTAEKHVRSQLAERDLLSYFKVVVCGDMVSRGKPSPDIYLKACKDIGSLPEHTFAIEDSYNGIRAASAAGMKAIMVPDIVQPDAEMERLAYRIFPSLVEVSEFFKS